MGVGFHPKRKEMFKENAAGRQERKEPSRLDGRGDISGLAGRRMA
jgi:hypothetical protein